MQEAKADTIRVEIIRPYGTMTRIEITAFDVSGDDVDEESLIITKDEAETLRDLLSEKLLEMSASEVV